MSIDKEEIKKLFNGDELICIKDFVSYQKTFFDVGQRELSKLCGITQGHLSFLTNKNSTRGDSIFASQDKSGKVAIFEIKRLDNSKAKVGTPKLSLPKKVTKQR